MKFVPHAPPFWETNGGPITDRIRAHQRTEARLALAEKRRANPLLYVMGDSATARQVDTPIHVSKAEQRRLSEDYVPGKRGRPSRQIEPEKLNILEKS